MALSWYFKRLSYFNSLLSLSLFIYFIIICKIAGMFSLLDGGSASVAGAVSYVPFVVASFLKVISISDAILWCSYSCAFSSWPSSIRGGNILLI